MRRTFVVAVVLAAIGHSRATSQTIWYVDAAVDGDGSNWQDAFAELQDALAAAQSGDTIRVAKGVYKPAQPGGSRTATFGLVSGVNLEGGYAGTTQPDTGSRDIEVNPTVLSGDLLMDDAPGPVNATENVFHVLSARGLAQRVVLDGLKIIGGNVNDGSALERVGGGLLVIDSDVDLHRCTFYANHADFFGGAVYVDGGLMRAWDCSFVANNAGLGGGAVESFGMDASIEVRRCRFWRNYSQFGGAIEVFESNGLLENCLLWDNMANRGGAIHGAIDATLTLNQCSITRNAADDRAGGVLYSISNPLPAFGRDHLRGRHGGDRRPIVSAGGPPVVIDGCILWENVDAGDDPLLGQISDSDDTVQSFAVRYSCVGGILGGVGNMSADPQFLKADGADGEPGTGDDDMRLSPQSPCINAGDPTVTADDALDLDGHRRVLCGRVDSGALEYGMADGNCDRRIDLLDFAGFQRCVSVTMVLDDECSAHDFNGDDVVGLDDFEAFEATRAAYAQ